MIYTCTLNPAIDYRMDLETYIKGGVNRATKASITPGGKGINVSIVLQGLGRESIPLGFAGGFTGEFLTGYLTNMHGLAPAFIPIDEQTRINVKLAESNDTKETEVNGPAPTVTDKAFERLLKTIRTLDENDVLILAGSDINPRFKSYETIAAICAANHVPFIVDAEKENVTSVLKYKPLLLKPNLQELESIHGRALDGETDILKTARNLIHAGAQHVIVSLGKEGSYFITEDKAYKSIALQGDVINTVGAGDSMVGGFVDSYLRHKDSLQAYKAAIAAGSATTFSPAFADKKTVDTLLEAVEIREVKL